MAGRSISLSLAAVDIVGQLLQANVKQFPFDIPGLGEHLEDRIRIAGAVLVDLQKRGLIRNGAFVPDVLLGLRLLSDFQVAIAVLGTVEEDRKVYARASTDGRDGVLVTRQDQMLRFEFIRPEGLVHSAVNLLPKLKAGPGRSVTIAQPEPAGAPRKPADDDGPELFTTVNGPRTSAESQLRAAEVIMQRPRTGAGDFVVTIGRTGLDPHGPGLTWLDTDEGRYMIRTERGKDGRNWGTFIPADNARLIQQLSEMVAPARFAAS